MKWKKMYSMRRKYWHLISISAAICRHSHVSPLSAARCFADGPLVRRTFGLRWAALFALSGIIYETWNAEVPTGMLDTHGLGYTIHIFYTNSNVGGKNGLQSARAASQSWGGLFIVLILPLNLLLLP